MVGENKLIVTEAKIDWAMSLLKEKEREVIDLRIDGWKLKQIAERMGVSRSRIGQRLAKARRQMRRNLANPNWELLLKS